MRPRRLLTLLLLATALVLGQQGAALHAFSHLTEGVASQGEKQALHGGACDQCVAYAGLASALPAADVIPPALSAGPAAPCADAPRPASPELRLSRARDPPVLL
jgi:hypothetical protein